VAKEQFARGTTAPRLVFNGRLLVPGGGKKVAGYS